jgi:glycosyltransferase involved in cell wall biosynthesis
VWHILAPPAPRVPLEPGPTPTFSVIIAAYQSASSIAEAIDSVLTQTHPPREIVVCDDGSTDGLERALEPYRDTIVFLRQENRGPAAARNAAAHVASGEFVSILDADDVFLPHYLEAMADIASQRRDLDILTSDAYLEVDGRIIGRYYPAIARFVVGDQRRGAIHNHFIFGLASLRRDRLLAIGGFDESLRRSVDRDCFLQMILAGAKAGLVDEPLARYRLREGSVSANRAASVRDEVAILEKAATHPTFTDDERAFLERELRVKRAETRLVLAEAAIRRRESDRRSRALDVAFRDLPPGFGFRTRVKAVAAAVAPSLAGRFMTRPERLASMLRPETRGR